MSINQSENQPLSNDVPSSGEERPITDQEVLDGLLSDDDQESGETEVDKFELIKRGDVNKLLMQIPPDFKLAYINGVRKIR